MSKNNELFGKISYLYLMVIFYFQDDDDDDDIGDDDLLNNIDTIDVTSIYKHDPISSLKPEENQIINACEDPDLKQLLLLNRKKNISLILLYKKLQDILMECKQYIIEKSSLVKEHINLLKLHHQSYGAWRLGAPYFKDKQLFRSPANDDCIRKKNNNELYIYDLAQVSKWSTYECKKIMEAVKVNYNFNKQISIESELKGTTNKMTVQKINDNLEKMEKNDKLLIPPLRSDEHIDWARIATVFLNGKNSFIHDRLWQKLHILHVLFNLTITVYIYFNITLMILY